VTTVNPPAWWWGTVGQPTTERHPRLYWRSTGRGPHQREYLVLVHPGEEQPGDIPYEGIEG
jgi:hypothetical protein